ncbi:LuxR family transcriptional regulator, maltose regulon positive regulatory protein [Prauserella marina]|uniref:LuxR family transcriptional regulator, maltose regulon positive regulatory protein n=1 Tax=Prauserella marina TaxID=530584 RepID=A0A1G6IRF8_9PSEU|nr:LuxR family maltose regulon positive regulatory protein [Prauserella marina]SDC09021.1 LuxR family transcriptional regulator, maltose regulon positive regulatory protein [Prauserella marina]
MRRPGLRDRLDGAMAPAGVTLVCAPPGYGKTLLLADWVEATGTHDKAWLTLDPGDLSAEGFLSAVLCAVRECPVVPGDSKIHDLAVRGARDPATVLASLVDAIGVLRTRLHLVLDDVQVLSGRETFRTLAGLVRDQPRNLRLVLVSSSEPPLPFARLRVEGRLSELDGADLRFSADEVPSLLRLAGVDLTERQTRRLVELTDGWAAGLRLAARSLRDAPDPDRFLDEYASLDRTIADFLIGEVLSRLPRKASRLLRLLSVCENATPALAATLSGEAGAGEVLAGLERENSLVTVHGKDRRWYRIHPLLRSYLNADLNRSSPELVPVLHKLVAASLAEEGHNQEALRHACRSGDGQAVVSLLRSTAIDLLLLGEPDLVLEGVAAAGSAFAHADPWLILFSALSWLQKGEFTEAERALALARGRWPAAAGPALVEFQRLIVSAHACALGKLPRAAPLVHWGGGEGSAALAAWNSVDRAVRLAADGERSEALRELRIADYLAEENGLTYLSLHAKVALSFVEVAGGDYPAMELACEQALALAARGGWRRSPWVPLCRVLLGLARLVHLDPAGALRAVEGTASSTWPMVRFAGELVAATAGFDRGERAVGLDRLHAARRELGDRPLDAALVAMAALTEHKCALDLSRFPLAREVAGWAAGRLGAGRESHLIEARTAFAHGDLDEAVRSLRLLRECEPPALVPTTDVEASLLESTIALAVHRRTLARQALDTALRLAEPAEVLRPFAFVDQGVRRLLVEQLGGFGSTNGFAGKVRTVLTGFTEERAETARLTTRELAVLHSLTSSRQLDEIASQLSVSVNTVKTHVRAIYAKLGVNSRRQAVVAARERGLD